MTERATPSAATSAATAAISPLYIDKRAGSAKLLRHIPRHVEVVEGIYDADIEFLGYGPDGPIPIGVEYKSAITGDIFTSLTDGRLTGTQLPRMVATYPRRYLLIEGPVRVAEDGVLEVSPLPGRWSPARGRGGEGWTAREYWGRLHSIEEFFGCPVKEVHNIRESVAWLVNLHHYWSRAYESHSSYKQWDRSAKPANGRSARGLAPASLIPTTSQLPLAQRWARELPLVGPDKSAYVARAFEGSALRLAMATAEEWAGISWQERIRTGPNAGKLRSKKFSRESIARIMREIGHKQ